MNTQITEMAIGALLHDVGKVLDRTGEILPETRENQFAYTHATWTAEFFNRIGNVWQGLEAGRVERLACYHHKPGSAEQRIVHIADRLAAGQDRRQKDEQAEIVSGRSRRPMTSIFSQIKLCRNDNPDKVTPWFCKVGKMDITREQLMPDKNADESTLAGQTKYRQLAEQMIADFKRIAACPSALLVENVIFLCRQYMSFVPSTTRREDEPDISLFDHSLTTAAISTAMYAWHDENSNFDDNTVQDNTLKKYALVSGDLSGIQDFILDLPRENAKGIAKALRARSFYLSMLTRCAADYLLAELGLPVVNRIMEAGGKFTLLVHNDEKLRDKLQIIRREIDTWLMNTFHGKLALNISEPLIMAGSDFTGGKYQDISARLGHLVGLAKKRKFNAVLIGNNGWDTKQQVIPSIVHKEDSGEEKAETDQERIHKELVLLGSELPKVKYILFQPSQPENELSIMDIFGKRKMTLAKAKPNIPDGCDSALQLGAEDYTPGFAGVNLANYVPIFTSDEAIAKLKDATRNNDRQVEEEETFAVGQVIPFNILATIMGPRDQGVELLGIFKADVDRLGMIFSRGIRKDRYSIGRITTLSRQLDMFFSGYLHAMLTEQYKYIYTEYAGGDDLLLLGPWKMIMDFASVFHREFKEYVCKNPDIDISASIILSKPAVPVSQSVRQAEHLLEQAKDAGRNRIAFLDVILSWQEYRQALANGRYLDEWVKNKQITTGFVYRLLRYYQMYKRAQAGSIKDMLWRSQLRYDIARNLNGVEPEAKDSIIKMATLSQKGKEMEMLKVSATYVLYSNRGGVL